MKQLKYIMIALLLSVLLLVGCGKEKEFVYKEHLKDVIATVDEKQILLSDLAFYVAYEEDLVEQQALIYSPENPKDYWNVHVNGRFLVEMVKDEIMKMIVRDEIYYALAMENKVTLTDEQIDMVNNKTDEQFEKLSTVQQQELGAEREDFFEYLLKMAYVEVYVEQLATKKNVKIEEYGVAGSYYLEELSLHKYQLQEDVIEKIKFGKITIKR